MRMYSNRNNDYLGQDRYMSGHFHVPGVDFDQNYR